MRRASSASTPGSRTSPSPSACRRVGIYCATQPEQTGLHGSGHAFNVGGPGAVPSVEAVAPAAGLGSQDE